MKRYIPLIILAIVLLVVWVMFFNDAPTVAPPTSDASEGLRIN